MRENRVQIATDAGRDGPSRPRADVSSPGTQLHRHDLHCYILLAWVPADQSSHRQGGKLSYMALALQREQTAYSSLLMLAGAVLADPEPMLARLVSETIT